MIVPYQGFVGSTYRGQSSRIDSETALNMYPELTGGAGVTPKTPLAMYPTPGTKTFAATGGQPVRDLFSEDGRLWAISGGDIYEVIASGASTFIGSMVTNTFPTKMAINGSGGHQLLSMSGGLLYCFDTNSGVFTQVTDGDLPSNIVALAFSDGYFLVASYKSRSIAYSALFDGTAWDGASVFEKSQTTDNIRTMLVKHKEISLIGSKTTEMWTNTGDALVTFAPIQGVLIEHGIGPVQTAATLKDTLCWIAQDADGAGIAVYAQGYTPTRFSTHAVEQRWAQYEYIDDAYAWTYQKKGHWFYVVSFPTPKETWVYDLTTNQWHERAFLNPMTGEPEHHLGTCHAFAFGKHLVGSRLDGTIYELSDTFRYDADTNPIRRVRRAPHVFSAQRDITINRFSVQVDDGIAATSGQGSDPRLMFRYSVDGGMTYSEEILLEQGALGEYPQIVDVNRLGQGADWVLEIATSEPIDHAWSGASIDAEGDA